MAKTINMTTGKPIRLILGFAVPILLGNLLQQLYNLVDSLIVGHLLGVTALAAVSASGWLDWAVLSIPMGLAQGFSIQAAQAFGADDLKQLRRTSGQSILIAGVVTVLLEIISQGVLSPMLRLINTPAETFHMTESYLRIIFAGLPVVMALNVSNGFLQALGDSRTPLVALAFSSLVNILLDWLFVGPLGMGTDGGAWATVAAQIVSAGISLLAIRHVMELHPRKEDLKWDGRMIRRLTRLGLPIAFQNIVISIGGLVLQSVVNGFGFIFMAGYNAASRLQGIIEISGSSLGNAVGTFTGQNIGAGNPSRVRQGLRSSALIGFGMALCIGGLLILAGRNVLSLFVHDEKELAEQVLTFGYQFLSVMAIGLPMLYLLFVYRSTLQGLGNTFIPMLSGFVELAMRVGSALLLPRFFGVWGIYTAEIAAWIGAAILLIFSCYRELARVS
ncbi:MAG: MATE family efflux transporter [Clostridia bacterium]|nr:MATE family efflux transporter [Clostridia bacterium]